MSKGTIVSGGTDGDYNVSVELVDGTNQTMQAYCADLTEDLSSNVGVLEIAGDLDKGRNIQPGYVASGASPAVYDADRDGSMLEVQKKKTNSTDKSQHSANIYYNWAIFPGWQKWRSKYRYGTITAISGDTCTVDLDACLATDTPDGKELDVNQVSSMAGVTIEYMDCNGSAFSVGDEVIVKMDHDSLNDWTDPKVIGFKEEPKGCFWEPWGGDTLCENHIWRASSVGECPNLPVEHQTIGTMYISLTSGILYFADIGMIQGGGHSLTWSSDNDNGKPAPVVGTMKIKLEANSSWWNGIRIKAGEESVIYVFAGTPPYPSWPYIGDNAGEEMEIDLTTELSVGADITEVKLYNNAFAGIGTTEMWIDYIDFI